MTVVTGPAPKGGYPNMQLWLWNGSWPAHTCFWTTLPPFIPKRLSNQQTKKRPLLPQYLTQTWHPLAGCMLSSLYASLSASTFLPLDFVFPRLLLFALRDAWLQCHRFELILRLLLHSCLLPVPVRSYQISLCANIQLQTPLDLLKNVTSAAFLTRNFFTFRSNKTPECQAAGTLPEVIE